MKKEPLTAVEKSTILSLIEQAKRLLHKLPPEEALEIYKDIVRSEKNV